MIGACSVFSLSVFSVKWEGIIKIINAYTQIHRAPRDYSKHLFCDGNQQKYSILD